jgi:hypothetical protein
MLRIPSRLETKVMCPDAGGGVAVGVGEGSKIAGCTPCSGSDSAPAAPPAPISSTPEETHAIIIIPNPTSSTQTDFIEFVFLMQLHLITYGYTRNYTGLKITGNYQN